MMELRGSQRKQLRAMAHALPPVCFVGKNGLSESLIASVREALADHELIKVKFVDGKEEKKSLTDRLAAETDSNVVGLIGNIAILFRQQPDPEKRKIELEP